MPIKPRAMLDDFYGFSLQLDLLLHVPLLQRLPHLGILGLINPLKLSVAFPCFLFGRSQVDLMDQFFGRWLHRLGQFIEDVGGLVHPQALAERVINMLLAVLESLVRFQEHPGSIARHRNRNLRGRSPHKGAETLTRREGRG